MRLQTPKMFVVRTRSSLARLRYKRASPTISLVQKLLDPTVGPQKMKERINSVNREAAREKLATLSA